MDTTIQTLSMLLGMASGLIQAFDIPVVCPSLSDWGAGQRTIEISQTSVGGIPLGQLLSRDWGGICAESNGVTSLPYDPQSAPARRA